MTLEDRVDAAYKAGLALSDRLSAEYEAATTDEERLAVLERYMGHESALRVLAANQEGGHGCCRLADRPPR